MEEAYNNASLNFKIVLASLFSTVYKYKIYTIIILQFCINEFIKDFHLKTYRVEALNMVAEDALLQ